MPRRIRSLGLFGKTARTAAKPNAQTQYAMDKYTALLPLVNGQDKGDSAPLPPLEGDPATLLRRLGPPLPFVLGGSPRLSVTRLMTKGWCELRYLYDARAGIPRPAAAARTLTRGTRAHARLEESAHPGDARVAAALRAEGMGEFVRTLPYGWAATLGRLLQLAAGGESRELLCHGWVRGSSDAPPVLVSGVVDRLSWEGEPPGEPRLDSTDIATLLPLLQEQVRQRVEHGNCIVVSDTKTRSTFTTPTQGSVLRATTMQLAYYRGYLEALAQDAPRTFASLLENARLHGVDADAPLQAEEVAALVRLVPSLQADAARLAAGEPVHMLVGPVTVASPRWLAARLAQGYAVLGGALGGTLRVEYYCRGTNFHTATVPYSAALRAERAGHEADAAAFLWGRRPVQPVARRLDALRTYCAHCDYAAVCGWKRGVERDLGGLGPALVRVAEGAPL